MISLLCPTRKRPDNIKRLIDSLIDTVESDTVECIFYVDEDDDSYDIDGERPGIIVKDRTHGPSIWSHYIYGPRIVLSEMWNECYKVATGPYYLHTGDDLIFRTKGWDTKFIEKFDLYPDKLIFAYADDGSDWGKTMGTHGMIHKNWVDTVGYFVPPYFSSDYNDLWLNEVAEAIGRKVFVPDVYIEHMHYSFGKADYDITHQERIARHYQDNVAKLYEDLAPKRAEDIQKLKAAIDVRA